MYCYSYQKEYGVPVKIARIAQTFGAGISKNENRVYKIFADAVINKENIVLKSKGTTIINYSYTTDTVIALLVLLLKGKNGEAYNVVGEKTNMTILENLSLADNKGKRFGLSSGVNKKRIPYYEELLKELDLGLEDKLYNKVNLLSGGQRQALSMLIAVMSKPKLLLLDEHTAALDPKTSLKIMEITEKIVKDTNITTMMVTHNLKQAIKTGNRLIMMHRGKILIDVKGKEKEELTTEKLMNLFKDANINDDLSDRSLLA